VDTDCGVGITSIAVRISHATNWWWWCH
jgi:hypothetical protein